MKYSIEQLKRANARHLWHPMAHPQAMRDTPPDIIARGEGVWIWDIDGHRMIDGVGGLWSANFGHSNRRVRDAIVAQLDELPYFNAFRGTTHPRAIELSEALAQMMAPDGVGAVMFGSGGSDAVEAALKIARQYWKVRGQADRTKFISLRQGYHGVHFGGMSVNGNTNFRRAYEPLLPGCFHVDTPWLYRNPYSEDPVELGRICAELLEREIVFQGPDTVAAFIAEPVQGAGGVIVPPENYWPLVREVCDRHGVLLIADEVVTGFGRLGTFWGSEAVGARPALLTAAKNLSSAYQPISAIVMGEDFADALEAASNAEGWLPHNGTYHAHPVAAAVALKVLEIFERRDLVGYVRRIMPYWARAVAELDAHPLVRGTRTHGLLAGIDLDDPAAGAPATSLKVEGIAQQVYDAALDCGLIVRPLVGSLVLSPPLVITEAEIDELIIRLTRALDLAVASRRDA